MIRFDAGQPDNGAGPCGSRAAVAAKSGKAKKMVWLKNRMARAIRLRVFVVDSDCCDSEFAGRLQIVFRLVH